MSAQSTDGREVLADAYEVYVAPSGTTFPKIDDEFDTFNEAWKLLGTNGNLNYVDSGVVVTLNETVTDFTGAGGTRPINGWRTAEGGTVALTLADCSIEQFSYVLDMATITDVAASSTAAGEKSISLDRGIQTFKYAILVRGLSPETTPDAPMYAQFEIERAYQSTNQAPAYTKGTPAELAAEFTILQGLGGADSCRYRAGVAPKTT